MNRKPRMALWLILVPLLVYGSLVGVLYLAQTAILFPTDLAGGSPATPPEAEELEVVAENGDRLRGLHMPPQPGFAGERMLVLGFGGNAWNAVSAAAFLHQAFPQAEVVVFYYRGYAPSSGRPSAAALQADALLIHDHVRRRLQTKRTIAVGISLGSGVATYLAAHRAIDGLILVTPFDSLAQVAADHYPWLPVRLLFRHRMEPAEDLRRANIPVAVIAAERDTLIHAARTDGVRNAASRLVFDQTIPRAGHNDLVEHPGFRPALSEALRRVTGAAEASQP